MGDYHIPISRFLRELFPNAEILPSPPITQRTIELGSSNSPDFICAPFKYNMGNYIEALEGGANILFQTGMGCRYGYYGEVQEQVLRDLGYQFTFICLSRDKARFGVVYKQCRKLNPHLTWAAFSRALFRVLFRVRIMDKLDYVLRERIGFELSPGSFEREKKKMLAELTENNTFTGLQRIYHKYRKRYQQIAVHIPRDALRVGVVGELYTLMEPFSNHYLEKQLARYGIVVSRKMSITFLIFGKRDRLSLRRTGGYLRYTAGANGIDSVVQSMRYARRGYDGILHIKSFGCTPELNVQPTLIRISRDMDIPILYLSFDSQTATAGIQTRIEAFADMITMKRGKANEKTSQSGGGRRIHLHQRRFYR